LQNTSKKWRVAQRCIMEFLDRSEAAEIVLACQDGEFPAASLPPNSLRLIAQLLGALSEGKAVTVVPAERELSTFEAAELLNVSRPFLIKQMEAKLLPYRLVGSHRRVTAEALLAYRIKMQADQADTLKRMADDAAALGLDY
jgi:excisionase family DNA binding protein